MLRAKMLFLSFHNFFISIFLLLLFLLLLLLLLGVFFSHPSFITAIFFLLFFLIRSLLNNLQVYFEALLKNSTQNLPFSFTLQTSPPDPAIVKTLAPCQPFWLLGTNSRPNAAIVSNLNKKNADVMKQPFCTILL